MEGIEQGGSGTQVLTAAHSEETAARRPDSITLKDRGYCFEHNPQ